MPDSSNRRRLLLQLLRQNDHNLTEDQLQKVADQTEGYSGSDLTNLARDAAMGPVRDLDVGGGGGGADGGVVRGLFGRKMSHVRPIDYRDFEKSLKKVRKSVASESLKLFDKWNEQFGDTE